MAFLNKVIPHLMPKWYKETKIACASGLRMVVVSFHGRVFSQGFWLLGKSFVIWSLFAVSPATAAPPVSEYQVKAIFLFNFLKYVEWPEDSFSDSLSPITIGVFGEDPFDGNLERTVQDKRINGRKIRVLSGVKQDELNSCNLLFISASGKNKSAQLLELVKSIPVLTVGEHMKFLQEGGIINFNIKDEKVGLEINLPASKRAGLKISSRLLSVADVVKK